MSVVVKNCGIVKQGTNGVTRAAPREGRQRDPRQLAVGRARTRILLVLRQVSVQNHASPNNLTVGIHSGAGLQGKRRPLTLLRGPGSGDGLRRGPILCRVSSVCRRWINVHTLVHCFLHGYS